MFILLADMKKVSRHVLYYFALDLLAVLFGTKLSVLHIEIVNSADSMRSTRNRIGWHLNIK